MNDPTNDPANDAGDSLSPAEQARLDELPRRRTPPADLEDRIVSDLKAQGLLEKSRWTRPANAWLIAAAAAAVALFTGGMVVGQRVTVRDTSAVLAAVMGPDARASRAARVQETGSAYVRAVAALSQSGGGTQSVDSDGLEAATVALHAAALELARAAPDDATIALVLAVLQERLARVEREGATRPRATIWF